jgi:NhaP-type Na+/H+ or K+/H+ antiporter
MLAPTDPVLASIVAVNHSADHDPLRFVLSAEAGLNDGSALPLLMLGLWLEHHAPAAVPLLRWALVDVLYAVPAGLLLGFAMGWAAGYVNTRLKLRFADTAPSDFLALALMALSYAAAEAVHASGFLAVFAAGLGLRAIEVYVVRRHPHPRLADQAPGDGHPPAESMVNPTRIGEDDRAEPAVMVGKVLADALSFGHTASRLLGAALVLLLGVALARHLDWRGLLLAALLFVLIRPLSVLATTLRPATPLRLRLLVGWLGVRGIGSLNYLSLALGAGLGEAASRELAGLTVTATVASVAVHGLSAQFLLGRSRKRRGAEKPPAMHEKAPPEGGAG